MSWIKSLRASIVVIAAWLTASCGDSQGPSGPSVTEFISRVTSADGAVEAVLERGEPPDAGSGPSVMASGPSVVITGGSSQIRLAASGSFRTVVVYVEGRPDYYRLTLPAAATSTEILVTIAQGVAATSFDCVYGVGPESGAIGPYTATPVTVVQVGTGDVQVNVSWDVNSDVDLHVVEPSGEEIYYGHDTSASGGVLDLDSNAACSIDGVRNENITWPNRAPPRGQYTVRVDYYDACGQSQTAYVVTVQVKGRAPQTFRGTFTGAGDQGAEGSGVVVARFTY